jgi:PIN domain nuclease of toxin-antitoxin system
VKYLLDTAPWINGITLPDAIPPRIRRLLGANEKKGLCRISLLETAILHRLGRLAFEGTLPDLFAAGLSDDVELLDLTSSSPREPMTFPITFPVTHSTERSLRPRLFWA